MHIMLILIYRKGNCQVFAYQSTKQTRANWTALIERANHLPKNKTTKTISIEWESFRLPFYLNPIDLFDNVLFMTMIRDPIERAWSDLNYNKTWHCNTTDLWNCAHFSSFWMNNFFVRMFSGLMPAGYREFRTTVGKEDRLKGETYHQTKRLDHIHLAISIAVLKQFDIVIVLEKWEEQSVQLKKYGMSKTTLSHKNSNAHGQMSQRMREYLIEQNQYDILFYEQAKAIADEKTRCALENT